MTPEEINEIMQRRRVRIIKSRHHLRALAYRKIQDAINSPDFRATGYTTLTQVSGYELPEPSNALIHYDRDGQVHTVITKSLTLGYSGDSWKMSIRAKE